MLIPALAVDTTANIVMAMKVFMIMLKNWRLFRRMNLLAWVQS